MLKSRLNPLMNVFDSPLAVTIEFAVLLSVVYLLKAVLKGIR